MFVFYEFIFAGAPLHKQLKIAILEGNEEKAIGIYQSKEMGKPLISTLHPSKPFPSKKNPNGETPLHLTAKSALTTLFGMFLDNGGRPDIGNSRQETCLHTVCSLLNNPMQRAEIVEQLFKWRSVNPSTNKMVSVNADATDIDGNTAVHLAAYNGLLLCLQKLTMNGVDIAVLNNSNRTCAEYADESGRANFGSMLELSRLYRPPKEGAAAGRAGKALAVYRQILQENRSGGAGIVVMDSDSLSSTHIIRFIGRVIALTSEALKESPARCEMLLMHYCWDARRLRREFAQDREKVLRSVNMSNNSNKSSDSSNADNSQALVVSSKGKGF